MDLLQALAIQGTQQQQHATMTTCQGGQNPALILDWSHPRQTLLQSLCHLPCNGLAHQPTTRTPDLLD